VPPGNRWGKKKKNHMALGATGTSSTLPKLRAGGSKITPPRKKRGFVAEKICHVTGSAGMKELGVKTSRPKEGRGLSRRKRELLASIERRKACRLQKRGEN